MSDDKLHEFGQRLGEHLRDSAAQLDGTTRSRLAQARANALEQGLRSRWRLPMWQLAPAGAVAVALVAVLLIPRGPSADPVNAAEPAALYDLELLADADALDLAEESDLDFIEWAAGMAELEGAGG